MPSNNVFLIGILREHFAVDHSRKVRAGINMKVLSNGLLSKLLNQLSKKVNKNHTISNYANTSQCVPIITQYKLEDLISLLFQVALLIALTFSEVYLKRFNRPICALIYRAHEKKRISWLYNKVLKKRRDMIDSKYKFFFKLKNVLSFSNCKDKVKNGIIKTLKQK